MLNLTFSGERQSINPRDCRWPKHDKVLAL
jgi:hypothetical protein